MAARYNGESMFDDGGNRYVVVRCTKCSAKFALEHEWFKQVREYNRREENKETKLATWCPNGHAAIWSCVFDIDNDDDDDDDDDDEEEEQVDLDPDPGIQIDIPDSLPADIG